MRPLTILTLTSVLLTACGTGPTLPGATQDADVPVAAQSTSSYTIFATTWASGRCSFRQSASSTADGELSEVTHNNGGYVRLWVKMLSTGDWNKQERQRYASLGTNMRIEVYAYCKVDGQWVGGMKYRTN